MSLSQQRSTAQASARTRWFLTRYACMHACMHAWEAARLMRLRLHPAGAGPGGAAGAAGGARQRVPRAAALWCAAGGRRLLPRLQRASGESRSAEQHSAASTGQRCAGQPTRQERARQSGAEQGQGLGRGVSMPRPPLPPTLACPLLPPACPPARLPQPQFCMLEPEILCRLVYVKEVECQQAAEAGGEAPAASAVSAATGLAQQQQQQQQQQGGGGSSGGLRAPPGTTELPTCPVCLERLDEHISGIVTTVGGHGGWGGQPCDLWRTALVRIGVRAKWAARWLCQGGGRVACWQLAALRESSGGQACVRPAPRPAPASWCRCATTVSTTSACGSGATPPARCAATASTPTPPPATARSAAPRQVGRELWRCGGYCVCVVVVVVVVG